MVLVAPVAALALAAAQPTSPAESPATVPTIEAIEAAVDGGEWQRALDLAYRLAEGRQGPDGSNRPDPELAYVFGRIHLNQGRRGSAISYLRRADSDLLSGQRHADALIALSDAQEAVGDHEGALASLARLEGLQLGPTQQISAAIRRARLTLPADPRGALSLAESLARGADPAGRFHGLLLAAQAHNLTGNRTAARQAAEQAWAAALAAPPRENAGVQAGLILAALTDQPERALSILHSVGGNSTLLGEGLTSALPTCGEDGLRPEDEITFAVFRDDRWSDLLMPVAANRPAIVATFMKALAGRRILGEDAKGRGIVFSLRCRTLPASSAPGPVESVEPVVELLVARNLFFASGQSWDAERVRWLEARIAELEARYGPTHLPLIPLVMELAERSVAQMEQQGALGEVERSDLPRRVASLVRSVPGAADHVPSPEDEQQAAAMQNAPPEQQLQLWRAMAQGQIARLPIDDAYPYLIAWLQQDTELSSAERQRAIETVLRRFDPLPNDPRRRALLIRLGRSQAQQGNETAAQASFRAARLSTGACEALPEDLTTLEGEVSGSDYPLLALRYSAIGWSVVEQSIGPDGRVAGQRLLIAAPPGLFDEVLDRRLRAFRFSAPMRGGRPVACIGRVQTVRWRLPEVGEPLHPFPNPDPLPSDT
jgi:tetratricopeptide (TPR) repeat protein